MTHRIEITFVGDAAESELQRAQVLGHVEFQAAINHCSEALRALGFEHECQVRVVRTRPDHRPSLKLAAE